MNSIRSFASANPATFVLILTVAWLILLLLLMGMISGALRRPYGSPAVNISARVVVTGLTLLFLWRLGWMQVSGVGRAGTWHAWLLALGGLIYLSVTSLYALYGKTTLHVPNLPQALKTAVDPLVTGAAEEILFRGLVLYALLRVWGSTPGGAIASVVVTALLFAGLHLTQVLTNRLPLTSALLLVLQTVAISILWGALVVYGGSVWPAVLLHGVVNALVAVQSLSTPVIHPPELAYQRLLWFSLPLGVIGLALLGFTAPRVLPPEVQ